MQKVQVTSKAKEELSKFFYLAASHPGELTMFSDYLDEAWHTLLEDKKDYALFSIEACGQIVEHIASDIPGASGYGMIEWIKLYENKFGKLDATWFMNSQGEVDKSLYSKYLETGEVLAAWKCTPKTDSGDD